MQPKTQVSSWQVFKEFLSILWRYRQLFYVPLIMTFGLQILWIVPRVAFPLLVAYLQASDSAGVGLMLLILLVNNYASYKLEMNAARARVKYIRCEFNNRYLMECIVPIVHLGYRFHVSFPAPRTEGRLDDADEIADMAEWMVENLVSSLMQFVLSFIPLALVMPPMIAFTFVVLIMFVRLTVKMIQTAEADRLKLRAAFETKRDQTNEMVEGNATIEINGATDRKVAALQNHLDNNLTPVRRQEAEHWLTGYGARREQLMQVSSTVNVSVLAACVLFPDVCTALTGKPTMSIPEMMLINGLVQPMFQSLWAMANVITNYVPRSMRIHSLIELTKAKTSRPISDHPVPLPKGDVEFQGIGVVFEYGDDPYAYLRNMVPGEEDTPVQKPAENGNMHIGPLDFVIKAGQKVAIVGKTGCGKTTLTNLLLGRILPVAGTLLVNGVDMVDIDPKELMAMCGVVTQDTVVFRTTALSNITIDDTSITKETAQHALQIASLDKDLQLDTVVGERGLMLSGGQRQRLTIARAVVKNPRAFILDEATASLDARTEADIQIALEEEYQRGHQPTVVAIAHRFSTIKDYDLILVMDKGQIVERGTHAELMQLGGKYAEMAKLQGMH